ncbi:hypothetical protein L2E82_39130 [Cichorium intybus]|uniref:Uncharacterized protein n=1 Tax=Cichorium intybus TaxID=13427 RepID=A0ACB9AH56_CICIN|nr:hypothetical protein L2E82_39130 [Cichorium intybus]
MASSEPPFLYSPPSSTEDLQQWLIDIPQALQSLLSSDTTLPVCIFKLPETRTSEKPDAYLPQHIGLGPIHHFRTDIYSKQEKLKLVTANIILKPYITSEFEKIVQESLIDLAPVAEYCYDLPFDIENDVLAWVFAIDALVVVDVLSKVRDGRRTEYLEDVIMVENQIPLVILVKLLSALNEHLTGDLDDLFLTNLLLNFSETRSPFKFIIPKTQFDLGIDNRFHLLDCMYHLIVKHTVPRNPMLRMNFAVDINIENVQNVVQTAGELFPCLNVFFQPILLVLKLPWDKIGDLIKLIVGEIPVVLEIDIPSVSRLAGTAKIEFSTTTGGIRDIEFDEEKLTFCLPVLELKSDSEVILRNLVAYEELLFKNGTATNLDFTEYVDFMCGIVDGVEDVKILREKNIILGDIEDEEIVKLFNGITKSSAKVDGQKSKLQNTIQKVNNHYGNIPRIKVFRTAKMLFLASWKTLVVVFSILSILLLIYVGVCQVYECKNNFGLGNVRSVIPYVTLNNKLIDS